MKSPLTKQATSNSRKPKFAPLIEKNSDQILALARKYGVCNVRVFGSMVKNEPNPHSDIDLLVELEEGRTGLSLGGFLAGVAELTQRKVDVVTEKAIHTRLRDKILKEAVPL
ncbi:MAG: nucleotidyltransferase family protein [Pseudohongiellaceae bacterium]